MLQTQNKISAAFFTALSGTGTQLGLVIRCRPAARLRLPVKLKVVKRHGGDREVIQGRPNFHFISATLSGNESPINLTLSMSVDIFVHFAHVLHQTPKSSIKLATGTPEYFFPTILNTPGFCDRLSTVVFNSYVIHIEHQLIN